MPERRAALLEGLLASFSVDELSLLLLDDRKQLEELEKLSRLALEDVGGQTTREGNFQVPVILTFVLEEAEATEVNLALDVILNSEKATLSRGQALVRLAHFYLAHHGTASNE